MVSSLSGAVGEVEGLMIVTALRLRVLTKRLDLSAQREIYFGGS